MKLETASRPGWPGQLSWAAGQPLVATACAGVSAGRGQRRRWREVSAGSSKVEQAGGRAGKHDGQRRDVSWERAQGQGQRGACSTHPECRRCRRCHCMSQRRAAAQSCSEGAGSWAGWLVGPFSWEAAAATASAPRLPASAAALAWHAHRCTLHSLVAQLMGEGAPLAVPLVRPPRKGAEVNRHHLGGVCLVEAVWHVGHHSGGGWGSGGRRLISNGRGAGWRLAGNANMHVVQAPPCLPGTSPSAPCCPAAAAAAWPAQLSSARLTPGCRRCLPGHR